MIYLIIYLIVSLIYSVYLTRDELKYNNITIGDLLVDLFVGLAWISLVFGAFVTIITWVYLFIRDHNIWDKVIIKKKEG